MQTLKQALPRVLLPEQMTQESFVESLTLCNGGAALWAIDEFTDTLTKMLNAHVPGRDARPAARTVRTDGLHLPARVERCQED